MAKGIQDYTVKESQAPIVAAGGTLVLPNKDAINAMFAAGSIIPFAVDSFKMGGAESTFSIIGIL